MEKTVPKYVLVENRIKQAIRQRVIVDKLPGERVLAREFGVSYMTLRKAVENLVAEGLLYKVPQLGTYVNHQGKDVLPSSGRTGRNLVAAIQLIAEVTGSSPLTPNHRAEQSGTDRVQADVQSDPDPELVKKLERENRELKRANEILQRVATYFAQVEQDRRLRQ